MGKLTIEELMKMDTLTDAYLTLVGCRNTLNQASKKLKQDFHPEGDEQSYLLNPIKSIDYDFKKNISKIRFNIIEFVTAYMGTKYNNLVIDRYKVEEFAEPLNTFSFSARAVIKHIEEMYKDEEVITLQQIKQKARTTLPSEYRFTDIDIKPEDIPIIHKTGLELQYNQYHSYTAAKDQVSALIMFTQIKLDNVLPSQAVTCPIIDYDSVYSDNHIKSLRIYKNGKLKVIFHTVEDMELIRQALVDAATKD